MTLSKWHLPRRTFRLKKSPPESVACEAAGLSASPTLTPTPTYPHALRIETHSSTWVTQAMVDKFCVKRHTFSLHFPPQNRKRSDEITMRSVHVPNPFQLLKSLIDFYRNWYEPCHLTTHRPVLFYLYGDHPFV